MSEFLSNLPPEMLLEHVRQSQSEIARRYERARLAGMERSARRAALMVRVVRLFRGAELEPFSPPADAPRASSPSR